MLNSDNSATEKRFAARHSEAATVSYDTLIVGAGLIGSSIAWLLAKAGLRVILLMRPSLGMKQALQVLECSHPEENIKSFRPSLNLGCRVWPCTLRLFERSKRRVGFRSTFANAVLLSWLMNTNSGRRCISVDSICTSTLRELAPGLNLGGLRGALYYPNDSCVAPQDLLNALKIACGRSGVTIVENSPVKSIHAEQDRVAAVTENGVINTRSGVLAAGAWSSQIPVCHADTLINSPVTFPIKGHMVGYQLAPGSLSPILRHRQHYVLQRSTGGSHSLDHRRRDVVSIGVLISSCFERSTLEHVRFTRRCSLQSHFGNGWFSARHRRKSTRHRTPSRQQSVACIWALPQRNSPYSGDGLSRRR